MVSGAQTEGEMGGEPAVLGAPARFRRGRFVALVGAVAIVLAGALAFALIVSSTRSSSESTYAYYRSMMGSFGVGRSSMMGGGYDWMMGRNGYAWMMGGRVMAPQWERGQGLPGFMMGSSADMGQVMGRLFADAPGPRVSASVATALGNSAPASATVDEAANRLTFSGRRVAFTVLASSPVSAEAFRIAGLTNPTVVVRRGATVSITVANADADMAHGLVVGFSRAGSSYMPMMTNAAAFVGVAVWFLGDRTAVGMHEARLTFTASTAGTYRYLCPVPGHADEGMVGSFVVEG